MKGRTWGRALITGASAGLGRAFALELAGRGTELVIVARDGERLAELAESVDVDVEVLAADLTEHGEAEAVTRRCTEGERPLDLLVNNAGIWDFGLFAELSEERIEEMIALNVSAVVRLSRAMAARMVSEGAGTILNVSSMAGEQPLPNEAVYAASKAFVTNFGQGLHEELRSAGVTVTTVLPGLTRTELHGRAGHAAQAEHYPGWLWMDAGRVAELSLRAAERGRAVYVPGFCYSLSTGLSQVFPRYPRRKLAAAINRRRTRMT